MRKRVGPEVVEDEGDEGQGVAHPKGVRRGEGGGFAGGPADSSLFLFLLSHDMVDVDHFIVFSK